MLRDCLTWLQGESARLRFRQAHCFSLEVRTALVYSFMTPRLVLKCSVVVDCAVVRYLHLPAPIQVRFHVPAKVGKVTNMLHAHHTRGAVPPAVLVAEPEYTFSSSQRFY